MKVRQFNSSFLLAAALTCSMMTFVGTPDASAQSTRVKTARSATVTVKLKKLELFKKRGVMTVTYRFSKRTWSELSQARITPTLALFLPERKNPNRYEYAYSVPLTRRKGALNLPQMNLRGVQDAEVRIVGYGGSYRITNMRIGSTTSRRGKYRLPVNYEGRPQNSPPPVTRPPVAQPPVQQPPQNIQAVLIKACKRNAKYNSGFNRCLTEARAFRPAQVVGVIDACGKGTSSDGGLSNCMRGVQSIQVRPAALVAACDSASKYDSGLSSCLKASKGLIANERPEIVSACGAGTSGDSGAITCINSAKKLKYSRRPQIIIACAKHTKYDSELSTCVQSAASRRNRPDALILTCGVATSGRTGMNLCITNSTKYNAPSSTVKACGTSTNSDSQLNRCIVQASKR